MMTKILWRIEGAALAVLGGICTANMVLSKDLHLPVWVTVLFFIGAGLCLQCSFLDFKTSGEYAEPEEHDREFKVFDLREEDPEWK